MESKAPKIPRIRRMFLITFIAELAAFAIISALPISDPALYTSFKSQDRAIISQPYFSLWLSIFPHNLMISSIEFIPIIGLLMFIISMGETAVVVSVEGTATHVSGFTIFASLMLLPHSWLELPAYAVAVSTGIYAIYVYSRYKNQGIARLFWTYILVSVIEFGSYFAFAKDFRGSAGSILFDVIVDGVAILLFYLMYKKVSGKAKRSIGTIIYMYLFVIIELGFAGAIEAAEIKIEETAHPFNALLMWIPGAAIIVFLIVLYRHWDRYEYPKYMKNDNNENNGEDNEIKF